jgi:capsular polysaccharide biosynthesis protein
MIIFPEYTSVRELPKNLAASDKVLFEKDFSKRIPAFEIYVEKNVSILADTVFSTKSFTFFTRFTHLIQIGLLAKAKRLLLFLSRTRKEEKGIWISDNWSHGYFHWFADALPRLIGSKEQMSNHVVLLPAHFEKIPFVSQSLKRIGQQVKYYKTNKRLHVKELLLPSHTAPTGHYNKTIINKVREAFLAQHLAPADKRIYISRAKATKRKVTNEEQIIPVLKSFNFEIHYFEEYDFDTQLNLMQTAGVLIGLHGAGLTNMLFMPSGGKVLEFRNMTDAHHNCYFALASDLGHNYYYLLNKSNTDDTHTSDITVDPEALNKTLTELFADK